MTSAAERAEDMAVPELTPRAQRILEVASELFYREGIHAVGVDTIAAESGVTKRTLYDRFGSKDHLVTVYLRARHHAWWERLEERLAAAPEPRVLAVFDAYAEGLLPADRGCAFLNAAAELPREHPGYRVVQAHKHAVRRRLEELLREEHPELETEAAAEHLLLLLEGAIAHRGIDGDGHLSRRARSIAEQLLETAPGPRAERPQEGV